jgi:hypothetical protein
MNGANPAGLIIFFGLMIWAFCILANKHRGFGYYLLAFLFPLLGLIVAACLKKKLPKDKKGTLDITDVKD